MDYLDSYVESYLQAAADDLKDSPLVEEMEARCEILLALANMKAAEEARRKKAYDNLYLSEHESRLRQENCKPSCSLSKQIPYGVFSVLVLLLLVGLLSDMKLCLRILLTI